MKHLSLGASLYVPATRSDLIQVGNGLRFPGLRSVIFCTEDALHASEVNAALDTLRRALPAFQPGRLMRFVRVRNIDVLDAVCAMDPHETLDGFVLPKVTRASLPKYLERLSPDTSYLVMPTLETREVFDMDEMRRLRDVMAAHPLRDKILMARIGGNDLMRLLGIRRTPDRTAYDTVLGGVISNLVTTFKPYGFPLSAPVFDGFEHADVLAEEVRIDLAHGLLAKTAIHPSQIATIHREYAVSREDLQAAEQLLECNAPAVFGLNGMMHEQATHGPWAEEIVTRAEIFGVVADARRHAAHQERLPFIVHN